MSKWIDYLKLALDKLSFLSDDEKLSLTNITVIIFVGITAFRTLFAGLQTHIPGIQWSVQAIDLPSVLPMLFSLLNYAHRRQVGSNETPK